MALMNTKTLKDVDNDNILDKLSFLQSLGANLRKTLCE